MSAVFDVPTYRFIDPYEIQCFPPTDVDSAMASSGVAYPDLLEAIAGLLVSRSPRFAQDLVPFLESYFHEHNYSRPLSEFEEASLRGMITVPETIDLRSFEEMLPNVLLKATTLAVETFVQKRPGWVLKAMPHLGKIRDALGMDSLDMANFMA